MLLLAVGTVIAAAHGCKKYDDGPGMSLRTKKARLTNAWKYDKVTNQNGTDFTANYVNQYVELKKDGNYVMTGSYTDAGTWQFASDKEDIVISSNSGGAVTWHILRLKSRELWVRQQSGSSFLEFHFLPR